MQSLCYFNKEGDNLNFRYNESQERWEGDMIFNENSNDTFKTIGLYLFEKVPSFEYENPGNLKLDKFQLFNEYKFNITGNSYMTQSVSMIELVNNDPNFYSKWVFGEDFESKYPVGTQIVFNNPIFEFTTSNQSYTVIQTKKNAILIISSIDNQRFNTLYGSLLGVTSSYTNITISGVNSVGVYNYVNETLDNQISSWSEPDFYMKYFNGKKLTLVNTNNDGVITVGNVDLYDKIYHKYQIDTTTFTSSNDLVIELVVKTDLPIVYTGGLSFNGNRLSFNSTVPDVLKPGMEFIIPSSSFNSNSIIVDSIPTFTGNTSMIYYATQSQVLWNNKIYECLQSYTWSATSSINPDNTLYWDKPTYLPITSTLISEVLLSADVHLTTNKIYYYQSYTQSYNVTLASAANRFANDFSFFNINLNYDNSILSAELNFPSSYAEVNFYPNAVGASSSGKLIRMFEQNVGIVETLKPESNFNINENFSYNIVFTDLDEYGLIIKINGDVYQQEIDWVYVGLYPHLPRTIDRTLRNWLVKWYVRLTSLGILATLKHVGSYSTIYYNAINLSTEYPNVPLQFVVEVGTSADYYIEHSELIFTDMSNYLSIIINGRSYDQSVTLTSGIPDIISALSNWIDNYSDILIDYGIYVSQINTMLVFRVKEQNQRLVYSVRTGKTTLPGIDQYTIVRKMKGNFGALIVSNEMVLPKGGTFSFEYESFATGQVMSINNTLRPYDNQEYNILYLGTTDIVLSYQGPFWGTTDPNCDVSPFVTIAFNGGFGATGCLPVIPPPITQYGGSFDMLAFTSSFSIQHSSNNVYGVNYYDMYGNSNIIDIIHLPISSSMYVLGDKLTVVNGELSTIITTIDIPGMSNPILMEFNPFNSYLYCLSETKLYVVDPIINKLIYTINLSYTAKNCKTNISNGDIYITYPSESIVDIWYYNNFTSSYSKQVTTSGNTYDLVYNEDDNCMYVTMDDDNVTLINGTTRDVTVSYSIPGLQLLSSGSIFYEPIKSSVYVFDSTSLININGGFIQYITSVPTRPFNDVLFNNIVGEMVISQDGYYSKLSLSGTLDSIVTTYLGYLCIGQYDGDVYLASQNSNQILIFDTITGTIKYNETFASKAKKLIYNPDRRSVYGIQPSSNKLVEITVEITSAIVMNTGTFSNIYDNHYGTLSPEYIPHESVWIKTRDYIRRPRENYEGQNSVQYIWKWVNDQTPQIFLYDFSGDQLTTSGAYAYKGVKPLEVITLNKTPNRNLDNLYLPEYQQTIFNEIKFDVDYIDSSTNISIVPEPMELFIGFRSDDEGPITSTLVLIKRELIDFSIVTSPTNLDIIQFKLMNNTDGSTFGMISLNLHSTSTFTSDIYGQSRGLKPGQLIKIIVSDITNSKKKYISFNSGKTYKIRNVYTRYIIVDIIDDDVVDEFTQIDDYPSIGNTTYLSVNFKVVDKELGRFNIYGQTEIEDIRYKIELSNTGHNITPDDISIFKSYDINEQGVDWGFLNRKRKEMMMVRHDIFPYVGSYKAIINSINYFGYNDLQLYEYYRNINVSSPEFFKLLKVEIPDIFDNSVEGWTVNDFIKHTMPNPNYEVTNLFNLTYQITDKSGNNVLMYSLQEVISKLQALKYWLQSNVIPITHKILDITGRADFVGIDTITHRSYDATILNIRQTMTPIDFSLNEAYLMPVNSGSTVYTCHIDFNNAESTIPLPDYFTLKIRTYKTYKEWNPFTTYNSSDKVIYYGKLYESVIDNNRVNNPRKYEDSTVWDTKTDYQLGQFVSYNRYNYEYVATQSSFEVFGTSSVIDTPYKDILTNGSLASWFDVTEWSNIDYHPVQTINEYRTGTHSFNFTIDSNIDPFVVIEVTSDNGYGQIYTSKKNYEIRGLNDISDPIRYIDPIGPFVPIVPITNI